MGSGAALTVGYIAHDKTDITAINQLAVIQVVVAVRLPVDGHRLDIAPIALSGNCYCLAVLEVQCRLVKIGGTDDILVAAGTYGVKP